MKSYKRTHVVLITSVLLFLALLACSQQKNAPDKSKQTVLLVSIDGFRWDYFQKCATPHFDSLAKAGVKADGLIPVFPSLTFPNHYSIITGLYAENHGIISNYMYDPVTQDSFSIKRESTILNPVWWGGEPLWNTAEKQGLRAASFFWAGSETAIDGLHPSMYKKYDDDIPDKTRIDSVLSWLAYPESKRPRFITLYFSFIDHLGHRYGPDSPEIVQGISRMDSLIGYLGDGLKRVPQEVNLVVVSDHGMAETSTDRIIEIDDYIDLNDVSYADWYIVSTVLPKDGKRDVLYDKLYNAHPNLHVFKKEDIPARFHFQNNARIHPLVLIADTGWEVMTKARAQRRRQYKKFGGAHGYDNMDKRMHGIFLASGPAFQKDMQVSSFQNVHIYDLICSVLNITPAPNDGQLDSVKYFAANPD